VIKGRIELKINYMKKILFVGAAAIIAAMGFSSFRTASTVGPYYFKVNTGLNISAGIGSFISPNQVFRVASVASTDCPIGEGNDCVVTFATSDLTRGLEHLVVTAAARNTLSTRGFEYTHLRKLIFKVQL
jgi:hypothetical protein